MASVQGLYAAFSNTCSRVNFTGVTGLKNGRKSDAILGQFLRRDTNDVLAGVRSLTPLRVSYFGQAGGLASFGPILIVFYSRNFSISSSSGKLHEFTY